MMGSTFESAALTNNNGTEMLSGGDVNGALKYYHAALQSFAFLQQMTDDEEGNINHDEVMIPSAEVDCHLGAQIDISSAPIGAGLDEPMTSCYYSRAFSISAQTGSRWCCTTTEDVQQNPEEDDKRTMMDHNDAVCCSIVCLFNLALTFQEKGRVVGPTALTRALRLYELAFELLVGCIGTDDILYMLYMAIVVNKIHVMYDLGQVVESQQELMNLLDIMTSTDVRPPAFDDGVINQLMFRIFLGPLKPHASAA